jgi:hypothetical protein
MNSFETEFHAAMMKTYEDAKASDYRPTYFLRMLQQYGGIATAKRLIAKHEIREGL